MVCNASFASPLMGVTNAISSVIIVGAPIAAGPKDPNFFASLVGFFAIVLASVNIFGGFIVTQRMLQCLKGKNHQETKNDRFLFFNLYLISAVLFILSLHGLSHPETARGQSFE